MNDTSLKYPVLNSITHINIIIYTHAVHYIHVNSTIFMHTYTQIAMDMLLQGILLNP